MTKLYIVVGVDDYPRSLAIRDKLRAAHFEYVLGDDEHIRLVGPMRTEDTDDINGSVYMMEAESAAHIQSWLDAEPYHRNGVYKQVIIQPLELRWNLLPERPRRAYKGPISAARQS